MTIFNAVCFVVLMDHHREGVEEAHPEYISEKLSHFERCSEEFAYAALDARNQARVREWCSRYNYPLYEHTKHSQKGSAGASNPSTQTSS